MSKMDEALKKIDALTIEDLTKNSPESLKELLREKTPDLSRVKMNLKLEYLTERM